jgi:murein DD-endopeptidase MepM/ murein hydrolase activator NlpD
MDACQHWDCDLAVDIFTGQAKAEDPEVNLPTIAYVDGTVSMTSGNDSLGGIYIILQGDDGRYYYYAHHCAIFVGAGDRVTAGQVIGVTDQTGMNAAVTPEHLHFAIQDGGAYPDFTSGGNVCPFTDFREKFGIVTCDVADECACSHNYGG